MSPNGAPQAPSIPGQGSECSHHVSQFSKVTSGDVAPAANATERLGVPRIHLFADTYETPLMYGPPNEHLDAVFVRNEDDAGDAERAFAFAMIDVA
jgi:hypothetical protein